MAGKARAKKEVSAARKAAMDAVKNAKSDQEKTVATQQLRLVRFKEVGSVRADKAIESLKNLSKACDRTSYAWTQEQADKLLAAINAEVKKITVGLTSKEPVKAKRERFSL
jgi:hypothetical protein